MLVWREGERIVWCIEGRVRFRSNGEIAGWLTGSANFLFEGA